MKRSFFLTLVLIIPFAVPAHTADKSFQLNHVLNCIKPLGHHLYIKEYDCPIGGEKFNSLALGTHSTYGVYLDLKPVSYMDFPPPLPVCPSNGFVIVQEKYTNEELDKIKSVIESEDYQKIYKAKHATYYLYSKLNEHLKKREKEKLWLLLKASWEASTCNDAKKYKIYATDAIEAAKKEIDKINKEHKNYVTFNILIPNLYRRMGEFEAARQWLNNFEPTLDDKNNTELPLRLLREAIDKKNTAPIIVKEPTDKKE